MEKFFLKKYIIFYLKIASPWDRELWNLQVSSRLLSLKIPHTNFGEAWSSCFWERNVNGRRTLDVARWRSLTHCNISLEWLGWQDLCRNKKRKRSLLNIILEINKFCNPTLSRYCIFYKKRLYHSSIMDAIPHTCTVKVNLFGFIINAHI